MEILISLFFYIFKIWSIKLLGRYKHIWSHLFILGVVVIKPESFVLLLSWFSDHLLQTYKVLTDVDVGSKLVCTFLIYIYITCLFLFFKNIFTVENLLFLFSLQFLISITSNTFNEQRLYLLFVFGFLFLYYVFKKHYYNLKLHINLITVKIINFLKFLLRLIWLFSLTKCF